MFNPGKLLANASAMMLIAACATAQVEAPSTSPLAAYADPAEPSLPQIDMIVTASDTAIVITDPQIDSCRLTV